MSGLRHSGLNERQVRLLRAIKPKDGACPTKLAIELGVPLPFVSRTSRRLVALGLIRRQRDAQDNRRVTLRRLPAGDTYLSRLDCLSSAVAA